ncbi:DUF4184 family protein [Microbacterium abyssi]|uniref:DUF4184 family protein n=1 Tax=Microbacterium abyssi TaxID=2782166 RepID=UPI0018882150|nr:DUF4184 family protein [Microbacterium sp. A18JL241]
MPFTPSHAIVALPFLRTPLVPAAIAIGAMTPDLPLFVRGFGVSYSFTHTYANIVWTMVLALGLFLLWRVVLRPIAPELSPQWLARRLPADWDMPAADALNDALGIGQRWTRALWLAASLLIGVVSHILWDGFTHEGRLGLDLVPALEEQWGPLEGFKWLQHGSSVIGLVIIGVWALLRLRRAEPRTAVARETWPWVRVTWWLSLPVILVAAWVIGYLALGPFTEDFSFQHLAYRVLPLACGIWAMLTLALCVVLTILGRRTPKVEAPRS